MLVRRQQSFAVIVAAALLSACAHSPSGPSDGLVASATSVVAKQDTTSVLRTSVTVVNRGASPAYLEYGACATRVLAYRAPGDAVPVWDSDRRRMWAYGQPIICLSYGVATTVAPGASLSPGEFTLAVPLLDVLGDSLPDGHYYFSASVGFVNRGPLTQVPAGDAELALARPPLAVTRRSFIMQWTATPVTVSGGTVVAKATGVVVNANSALIQLERNCPVLIRVYRDRARRDAAPRSGAPDWSQPACVSARDTAVLYRGDMKTFETAVPIKDILGASLPSGRYYFAVLVKGDDMEMVLSAGELDLVR